MAQDCVKLRDWADNIRQHKSVVPTCVSPKPVNTALPFLFFALLCFFFSCMQFHMRSCAWLGTAAVA